MRVLKLTTGPVGTNVWIVGDLRTREAIAIDTATPSVRWLTQQLADEFKALARTMSVPTPAMDRLYSYIDPAIPPLPEGSAQISPSWRRV